VRWSKDGGDGVELAEAAGGWVIRSSTATLLRSTPHDGRHAPDSGVLRWRKVPASPRRGGMFPLTEMQRHTTCGLSLKAALRQARALSYNDVLSARDVISGDEAEERKELLHMFWLEARVLFCRLEGRERGGVADSEEISRGTWSSMRADSASRAAWQQSNRPSRLRSKCRGVADASDISFEIADDEDKTPASARLDRYRLSWLHRRAMTQRARTPAGRLETYKKRYFTKRIQEAQAASSASARLWKVQHASGGGVAAAALLTPNPPAHRGTPCPAERH